MTIASLEKYTRTLAQYTCLEGSMTRKFENKNLTYTSR